MSRWEKIVAFISVAGGIAIIAFSVTGVYVTLTQFRADRTAASLAARTAATAVEQSRSNADLLACLLVVVGDSGEAIDDPDLLQRCLLLAERRRALYEDRDPDEPAPQPEPQSAPEQRSSGEPPPASPSRPEPAPQPSPQPQPPPEPPEPQEPPDDPEPGPVERVCDLIGVCP